MPAWSCNTLALQWVIEGGDPTVDAVEADGHRRAFDLVKELTDTEWPLPEGFTMQPSAGPAKSGALTPPTQVATSVLR